MAISALPGIGNVAARRGTPFFRDVCGPSGIVDLVTGIAMEPDWQCGPLPVRRRLLECSPSVFVWVFTGTVTCTAIWLKACPKRTLSVVAEAPASFPVFVSNSYG